MNAPERRPSSPLSGILVSAALFYGGWYLMHGTQWYVWGLALMGLGLAVLIKALANLIVSSFKSAHQIDLLRESRKLSYAFGHARLAIKQDHFVQQLAKNRSGFFLGALDGLPLFYDPFARGNGHMLAYAPSRTGKTISFVIPALLHWFSGSFFVTDVKGELTAITAALRRACGQRIVILNPFGTLGIKGLSFNPLRVLVDDILKNQGKELSTLVLTIAFQLIPERVGDVGDGKFFRGGARRLIIACLFYMAAFTPGSCNLPNLRSHIWSTSEDKKDIAAKMQGVDWFGGLLRDYGNMLSDLLEPQYIKTYGGFRDNAMDALEIYDAHSDLGRSTIESDFTLADVLDGKTTLYVILPESKLETHGSWMGLITTLLIEAIAAASNPKRMMMMLEEMGNLGRIPNMPKALSLLPGKNVRLAMIAQSRRQPVDIYGPHIAALIEEQSSCHMAWSIRSEEDRKAWSARIGTTTKKARSLSRDPHDKAAPWRLSVGERAAPVLAPDEIGRLPEHKQLIAIDGKPVILADKVPYFEVKHWAAAAAPNPCHVGGAP